MRQNKLFLMLMLNVCVFLSCGCSSFSKNQKSEDVLGHVDSHLEDACYALITRWLSITPDLPTQQLNRALLDLAGGNISREACFQRLTALSKSAPKDLHVSLDKKADRMEIVYEIKNDGRIMVTFFFSFDENSILQRARCIVGHMDFKK